MMVVFSLVITMRLARPRSVIVVFSSDRPTSSEIDLAIGQDGDVFQDRLATVAEARRLDGGDLDDAADGVDHQGGQRLALDFLGHDQQRLAGLGDGFQHRQQLANVGDLLVVDEDERVVQLNLLATAGC